MFKRMDEIMIEIPEVKKPDPNAAAAVQELLGGKFGEMSTSKFLIVQSPIFIFQYRHQNHVMKFSVYIKSIPLHTIALRT